MLGVVFLVFFSFPLSTSYPLAAVKHGLLCKLGIQEPNFLQQISGSCSTPASGDQLQKCVPSLLTLC